MAFYDGYGNSVQLNVDGGGSGVTLAQHIVENPNLANPNEFEVGWVGTNGTLSTANTGTRTTNYIPCAPGQIVTVGGITRYNHNPWFVATNKVFACLAYCFFDASYNAIGGATGRPDVSGGITAPDGAAFIRVTFFSDVGGGYLDVNHLELMFVHVGELFCDSPKMWFADGIERQWISSDMVSYADLLPHAGKTWVLFGDSLTDKYGGHGWDMSTVPDAFGAWTDYFWASKIARRHGLVLDNRAKSGSNINISSVYNDVSGVYMLDAFLAEVEAGTVEQPAIITIGFGSNTITDEIGTMENTSADTSTVYGATKYYIERLREVCPESIIMFILPPDSNWQRDVDGGREAIKAVCDSMRMPYINMLTESGITADMLPDGVHLGSKQSNNLYAHAVESRLF